MYYFITIICNLLQKYEHFFVADLHLATSSVMARVSVCDAASQRCLVRDCMQSHWFAAVYKHWEKTSSCKKRTIGVRVIRNRFLRGVSEGLQLLSKHIKGDYQKLNKCAWYRIRVTLIVRVGADPQAYLIFLPWMHITLTSMLTCRRS